MEFKKTLVACVSFVLLFGNIADCQPSSERWAHVCGSDRYCRKVDRDDLQAGQVGLAIDVCKFSCASDGNLWPLPTGQTSLGTSMTAIYPKNITFVVTESPSVLYPWLNDIQRVFIHKLLWMHPSSVGNDDTDHFQLDAPDNTMRVQFKITSPTTDLSTDTNEAYNLTISKAANEVTVSISAETYFGARHGLETLSQLLAYDDYDKSGRLQVLDTVTIIDKPVYSYRGVMLDTTRNFMPIHKLKKFIDGLSYSKLNVFHWHITDTHSFPMEVLEQPEMTEFGAYSESKIYKVAEMKDLVVYAKQRGVKIVAEFDAPAHIGNGWEWGPSKDMGNLAVCVNSEPWYDFCVEPPCGQLNLANQKIYDVLEKVYANYMGIFDKDVFHMGGDEVHFGCYNSSKEITDYMAAKNIATDEAGFVQIWDEFQSKARDIVLAASGNQNTKIILWTSTITDPDYAEKYINKDDYIIQIWSDEKNSIIPFLLDNGYKTIFSNYDALYLDCGYHAWIGTGHNWCSPYKGWQTIYDNNPYQIYANSAGTEKADAAMANGQILGEIAPLWAEQSDENVMESKVWPRAAALAERLWTNPKTTWLEAERRMVNNRKRIVQRGIQADRLQPEWCYQNENQCPGPPAVVPPPPPTTEAPDQCGGVSSGHVSSLVISVLAVLISIGFSL